MQNGAASASSFVETVHAEAEVGESSRCVAMRFWMFARCSVCRRAFRSSPAPPSYIDGVDGSHIIWQVCGGARERGSTQNVCATHLVVMVRWQSVPCRGTRYALTLLPLVLCPLIIRIVQTCPVACHHVPLTADSLQDADLVLLIMLQLKRDFASISSMGLVNRFFRALSRTPSLYTFGVDPSGAADFRTLTEALAQTRKGDRILVAPGIYPEELCVKKSVELVARDPRAPPIIVGDKRCVFKVEAAARVRIEGSALLAVCMLWRHFCLV